MTEPLPAGWAPNVDLYGAQWSGLPDTVKDDALQIAVRLLWMLSGRQFGTRTIKMAPYVPWPRQDYYGGRGLGLSTVGGGVRLGPVYGRGYGPGPCLVGLAFRIPGPVVEVTAVFVDDVELPRESWQLDPDGVLVRTDGQTWPMAQNVYVPRWIIHYVHGVAVDAAGNAAAGRFALEIAKALTADPSCRLNPKVRDVVRGGISMSLESPADLRAAGMTGIAPVDRWIGAVNPQGQPENAQLYGTSGMRHRILA